MMYAFSRACMVFTTANSSAMLSYLRRACPSGQGHEAPRARHQPTGCCRCGRALPHVLRALGVEAAQGRSVGLRGCAGGATWALDSLLPLPGILVQLHLLLERGSMLAPGWCSHGHTLWVSATPEGVRATHLIQLWLVSRGCNRAGRELAVCPSTHPSPSRDHPRLRPHIGGTHIDAPITPGHGSGWSLLQWLKAWALPVPGHSSPPTPGVAGIPWNILRLRGPQQRPEEQNQHQLRGTLEPCEDRNSKGPRAVVLWDPSPPPPGSISGGQSRPCPRSSVG